MSNLVRHDQHQSHKNIQIFLTLTGKKWASVWNPELGVKGREGDKICQQVADRLNVTSFPNRVFPRGIMVMLVMIKISDSI